MWAWSSLAELIFFNAAPLLFVGIDIIFIYPRLRPRSPATGCPPVYISPPVSSLGSGVAKGLKSPTHIDAGDDAAFGPPSPRINLWTPSLGSRTLLTILL